MRNYDKLLKPIDEFWIENQISKSLLIAGFTDGSIARDTNHQRIKMKVS
jgi:hypothetical protein